MLFKSICYKNLVLAGEFLYVNKLAFFLLVCVNRGRAQTCLLAPLLFLRAVLAWRYIKLSAPPLWQKSLYNFSRPLFSGFYYLYCIIIYTAWVNSNKVRPNIFSHILVEFIYRGMWSTKKGCVKFTYMDERCCIAVKFLFQSTTCVQHILSM